MQNVPKCFARTTIKAKFTEFYANFIYYISYIELLPVYVGVALRATPNNSEDQKWQKMQF